MVVLPLTALYQWDESLFDGLTVPEQLNKDFLVDYILENCGDFGTIYADAKAMKNSITAWARAKQYTWEKLCNTLDIEYNPIENYNRMEEWEDASESGNESGATNIHSVTAFNSGSLQTANQDKNTNNFSGNSSSKHTGNIHGNIGVTTTQQMLKEEREIAMFSIYDAIVKEFKGKFCVCIY